MSKYAQALDEFLSEPGNKVMDLAAAIGTQQPNITRYRLGERFPNADVARAIENGTGGKVPFALWQAEFLARAGISIPAEDAA